jgi:hypothetical protein
MKYKYIILILLYLSILFNIYLMYIYLNYDIYENVSKLFFGVSYILTLFFYKYFERVY